jgi:hypothetical protein
VVVTDSLSDGPSRVIDDRFNTNTRSVQGPSPALPVTSQAWFIDPLCHFLEVFRDEWSQSIAQILS